eukprot:gene17093-22606_t
MWNIFKNSKIYWISCIVVGLLAGVFYRLYIINLYPPRFYLPGLLSKGLHPTSRNSDEVKWNIPESDDLGINDLSGGAGVATPNIDSIAKEGVKFSNGYSGHATCAPSRAAIMTGRFSTRFGFEFTPVPKELAIALAKYENHSLRHPLLYRDEFSKTPSMLSMTVPLDEEFIAQKVQKYDYNSYYIGKWHLGEINGSRPMEKGYTDSLTFLHGASLYLPLDHVNAINAPVGGALDDFLRFNLDFSISHSNGHNFQPTEYMTDYLTSETVNLIRNLRPKSEIECDDYQQPFFITLAYNAPHNPLQALESDYTSPELANITSHIARVYAAMIKALDRGVGRVIDVISEVNETDNTMIIFTSDNGGAHYLGLSNINYPYRGWKATLFEGGLRVPFYIKLPDLISPGLIVDTPVGHVDIFNTILAVASSNHISDDNDDANTNNKKMDDEEQAEPLWPALIEVPIPIDKTDKVQENENDEYVYWAN